MIGHCKQFLMDRQEEWRLPKTGEWNLLLNNNYHPHYSSLNLLWFHKDGEFPTVITKVFPEPQIPNREFENLRQAHRYAPALVPQPLHIGSYDGFWMLWMQGVPGFRFRVNDGCSPAVMRSMVEMVISLHGALRKSAARIDPDRRRRMVLEPLQTVVDYCDSASIRDGCSKLASRSSADWVHSLPVIPQHGDLFAGNVLSHHDRWAVVDWESFGVVDLPFYDLFTLVLSVFRARGDNPVLWDEVLVKQVPTMLDCYTRSLHLSPADIELFLPLTLVNWFHLQCADGRKEFMRPMGRMIQDYFENTGSWEKVFRGA